MGASATARLPQRLGPRDGAPSSPQHLVHTREGPGVLEAQRVSSLWGSCPPANGVDVARAGAQAGGVAQGRPTLRTAHVVAFPAPHLSSLCSILPEALSYLRLGGWPK